MFSIVLRYEYYPTSPPHSIPPSSRPETMAPIRAGGGWCVRQRVVVIHPQSASVRAQSTQFKSTRKAFRFMDERAIDSRAWPRAAWRCHRELGDFRTHVTLSITVYRIPELLYFMSEIHTQRDEYSRGDSPRLLRNIHKKFRQSRAHTLYM